MRGLGRIFGRIGKKSSFCVLTVMLLLSQLTFIAPVFAADYTVSGKVTGGNNSQPIANATVEVLTTTTGALVGSALTDAAGDYAITVVEDIYNVRITPPANSGYQVSTLQQVDLTSSQTLNVVLVLQGQPYSYSGTLRDQDNTPIGGATVRLLGANDNVAGSGITSSTGAFSLNALAGQYKLSVESGNGFNLHSTIVAVNLTAHMANQNLIVSRVKLTINMVDADGNPVNGIQLAQATNNIPQSNPIMQLLPNLPVYATTATGSGSSAGSSVTLDVFAGAPIVDLRVFPSSSDYKPTVLKNLPAITGPTTMNVVVQRTLSYSGTLRDQDDRPFTNTTIRLIDTNGNTAGDTLTDGQGNFTVKAIPGQYKLSVESGNFFNLHSTIAPVSLTSNISGQKLVVSRVKLTVNVVDNIGTPVTGIQFAQVRNSIPESNPTVQLLPNLSVYATTAQSQGSSSTNTVVLDVFPSAAISRLQVTPASSEYKTVVLTNLSPITTDSSITVTVPRTLAYSGALRDQDGNAIGGATVRLVDINGNLAGSAKTAPNGDFTVSALTGQYKLSVEDGNFFNLHSTVASVNLTSNISGQNLVVSRVKLTVKVVDNSGDPVNGIQFAQVRNSIPEANPIMQLLPNLSVYATTAQSQGSSSTNTVVLDVFPGAAINRLQIIPMSSEYKEVLLVNLAPITSDTTMTVVVQRPVPPDVPQNVSAISPTNTAPVLSWSAVQTATSYKVFRNGVEVDTTATTSYTDSSLVDDGTKSYSIAACNEFGCSGQSSTVTVIYDTTAPVVDTPVWSDNPQVLGSDTTVTVSVSDTDSGVTTGEYFIGTDPGAGSATAMTLTNNTLTATLDAELSLGDHVVNIRAKDAAGNWSLPVATTLTIKDSTPPVIEYLLNPETPESGWYTTPVTLAWTAGDHESAIIDQQGCNTQTIEYDTPGVDFTCTATSAGGSAAKTATIKYDATAPVLGKPAWLANPQALGSSTSFRVVTQADMSGVVAGEYFVGTDPGVGNGIALTVVNGELQSSLFGDTLLPGMYNVGIRARDAAGNWSAALSTYLVIYDPFGPNYLVGQHSVTPGGGDILPWISTSSKDFATFGFNVGLTDTGAVDAGSEFKFSYVEKGSCNSPNGPQCHAFILEATSFEAFALGGVNSSNGTFQGTATLIVDGVVSSVVYRIEALDGNRLSPRQDDNFVMKVSPQGSDPSLDSPLYQVTARFAQNGGNAAGNIQIRNN